MSARDYMVDSLFHFRIGILATQGLHSLRLGLIATLRDVEIWGAHGLPDVSDDMRLAGIYPLRSMRGSLELWPGRPAGKGIDLDLHGVAKGRAWLRIVLEMLHGLSRVNQVDLRQTESRPHCHKSNNRCGPAGIGSTRGKWDLKEYCGRLILQAFPDQPLLALGHEILPDGLRDHVQIGGAKVPVMIGLPCIRVTQGGGRWLDLGPSGKTATFCISIAMKLARLMLRG